MIAPIVRVHQPEELASAAAAEIASRIAGAIAERGVCRIALAGGGTPRPVYEALAAPELAQSIAWDALHVYWGDERCVPPEDKNSNYRMAMAAFGDRISPAASNVFRIEGERSPAEAARAYSEVLGDQPLDILLLGMGGDGHTASLFPDTPTIDHGTDWQATDRVVATTSPVAPHDRVSLSLRAINEARAVYFLIAGESKAQRLAQVLAEIESGAPVLPAARVQPASGQLYWLIDSGAAQAIGPYVASQTAKGKPS